MARRRGLHRTDTDPGWINRRFRYLERQIQELSAAKGLSSSTIGSGGLRVKDGGGITIEDGGGITITDSGVLDIADGKIINQMLESPVLPETLEAEASNFSLTGGTYTDIVVAQTVVPAGYSKMIANIGFAIHARNTRAVQDYIGATVGTTFVPITDVQPGYVGGVSHSIVDFQQDLPEGEDAVIRLQALSGGGNWGADAFNGASLQC
ncbi:MAG: hypothetical protein ACRDXB_06685, partial [Actinomycetes bacterium]